MLTVLKYSLLVFIRIDQRRLNSYWAKTLIQHTPNSYIVSIYFVINALMEAIRQCTVITKMDFINPCIIFKLVNFTKDIVLESCS